MEISLNNKTLLKCHKNSRITYIKKCIEEQLNLDANDYYLLHNGKIVNESTKCTTTIHIISKLVGGKGGFGSMLRAIGAQIEKTTNREACRDLSGRRLRDINEEQRLKNWISTQAEREKEAAQRKQKKLEKLCEQPKHEFKDEEYDKERSALPEKVEDAVTQGMKASCSGSKRKSEEKQTKKKKPRLWIDADLSSSGASDDSDDEGKNGPEINAETSSSIISSSEVGNELSIKN